MQRIALFVLIVACYQQINAQLYWKWAYNSTNNQPNQGNIGAATAIDDAGNVYVAGSITDTCTIGNINFTPRPIGDMLVMKYNKAGALQWAKAPQGTSNGAVIQSIITAPNGDIYISGWATTPGYFDNIVSGVQGIQDQSFIARMDADGNFLWVKTCEGVTGWSHLVKCRQLAVDADNNVYFSGTATIGAGHYFDTVMTAPVSGVIMVKLDPTGNVKWRHTLFGNNTMGGSLSSPVMRINSNKELIYATTIPRLDTLHSNSNYCNLAIGKLDSNGHRLWHTEYGDTLLDNWLFNLAGFDMDVDDLGNFYVMGSYNKAFQIQAGPNSGSNGSTFVTKFNNSGTPVWSKFISGQYAVFPFGAKYNTHKRQLLCTGNYLRTITFGNHTLTAGPNQNSMALFVAAYDTSGNIDWLASYGKADQFTTGYGTAINNQQKMFAITGRFEDSTYFGNLGLYTTSANFHEDFFVAVASLDSSKSTTSLTEELTGINFSIYPNPANAYIQIETEGMQEPTELSVLNTLGQQVYNAPMQSSSATIDLTIFANGHYLVVLKRGNALLARPLIVSH